MNGDSAEKKLLEKNIENFLKQLKKTKNKKTFFDSFCSYFEIIALDLEILLEKKFFVQNGIFDEMVF